MWSSFFYKPLSFQTLRNPQFLSDFLSPKFKFSISRKYGDMTKTSISSDKNVPLFMCAIEINEKYLGCENLGGQILRLCEPNAVYLLLTIL